MKKKIISIVVAALLLALNSPAEAQQAGKVPRIGFLDPSTASGTAGLLEAFVGELSSKRLEILKDAVPKLARVGLLRGTGGTLSTNLQLKELRAAAVALKLKLEVINTQPDPKGLESAFQIAKQKQMGAIMTTISRPFFAERKRIVELAGKYRLPAIYPQKEFVDEGGLMSYGFDSTDLYQRAAHYADKILKGAKPADLPVQQATKFEFVINLKRQNKSV